MCNSLYLPKDVINIFFSYLESDEQIYYRGETEWIKFNKNKVCEKSAKYGWIDLLEWGIINDCRWRKPKILQNAAQYGQYCVFEWFTKNNFEVQLWME